MEEAFRVTLAVMAVVFGGIAGFSLWLVLSQWRRRSRHRSIVVGESETAGSKGDGSAVANKGLAGKIVMYAQEISQRMRSPTFHPIAPPALRVRPWPEKRACWAGVDASFSGEGFWEARVRLSLAGLVIGALAGSIVSQELAVLLGVVGLVLGWLSLPRALGSLAKDRARVMERDLSEMLDVVALGLHSGLSFERSLDLYTGHFSTSLSVAFRSAQRQWTCGLAQRADALRHVASTYESQLLDRVVENVIRSLRFGSTLADNLEDAAREARNTYKTRRLEEVARAPVKMMVPTGVLILPAMLILVLGPVLLELAGGF